MSVAVDYLWTSSFDAYDLLRRACIDSSEEGELTEGILLGEYRITHEYRIMNTVDQYTISVNVHSEGNILEIVGMCCKYRGVYFNLFTTGFINLEKLECSYETCSRRKYVKF